MRKHIKNEIIGVLGTLLKADKRIKELQKNGNIGTEFERLLEDCQMAAISVGNSIEASEGEDTEAVRELENYCEVLYAFSIGEETSTIKLDGFINRCRQAIEKFHITYEAVFLPYKASMWDSLESVYEAACKDPDCEAYVIPIPYYEKNPDKSIKKEYYEGDMFPEYVPVTDYGTYDIEQHHPDMIFIHNPYDEWNYVTSVYPEYYSSTLKNQTDCLVYIPYFATSGGMGESWSMLPAYIHSDYIVIQSEKLRDFYDSSIPDKKFLVYGSPKFDSIINKCKNPPEAPAEWKEMMRNKKVYFYNTSLGGMLFDTTAFLRKMEYVFETFRKNRNACLLWRPHPLLESTFESLRPSYKPVFDKLKEYYISEKIGIYDTTPMIEDAVALSDCYIGDEGTSVTSLFGVSGKPMFIFNNYINSKPDENSWRGEMISGVFAHDGDDRWIVAKGNKLWYSQNNDYNYKYVCDLNEYAGGNYYSCAREYNGKVYIFPQNACNIAVYKNDGVEYIELGYRINISGLFSSTWYSGKYAFIIPYKYPYMVRFDMETEEIRLIEGVTDFLVKEAEGNLLSGGIITTKDTIILASPVNASVMIMDSESLDTRIINTEKKNFPGCSSLILHNSELWMLPVKGYEIEIFNMESHESRTYNAATDGYKCLHWPENYECDKYPFGNAAFYDENVVLSPAWGNMYVEFNLSTGAVKKWMPPHEERMRGRDGYLRTSGMGGFIQKECANGHAEIFFSPERRLYDVDLYTGESREIEIKFERNEVKEKEEGFAHYSQWQQYCCVENAFNTLEDLINGNITGNRFDKELQISLYNDINVSPDGDCGEKVYSFVKAKLAKE